jgi:type VI secretion system protein ImpK
MSDDPFAEPFDPERTVIRPRPAGVGRDRGSTPPPASPPTRDQRPLPATGVNQLAAIASGVLAAAIRIDEDRARGPDLDRLRQAMVEAVHRFENAALATGMDTNSLRAARYALCATVDDIVLSTPEGRASSWTQQGLTSIFHGEVVGGERFFEILEQMERDLGRQEPVVELMYLCLSLGFVGRYRVRPRGVAELTDLRDGIFQTIRQRRGEYERELSPTWRGIDAGAKALARRIPIWARALGTVTIAALMYIAFTFMLSSASEVSFAELYGLPPRGLATIPRQPVAVTNVVTPPTPAAAPAAPPTPPPPAEITQTLRKFLAPEIKEGLVQVFDDAQTVTVRLTNRNMFASGAATLSPKVKPLLDRIGDALNTEKGAVDVYGYTDSQPIHTARFPSNFELSQARANAVAELIRERLKNPRRLTAQGRGQTNPIASNATAEGRQMNRRTEIVLIRTYGAG